MKVPATLTVRELAARIARGDPELGSRQGTPITDGDGKLAGIVTRSDLMRSLEKDPTGASSVLEAGARRLIVAHPDEVVRTAVDRMLANDIGRLPVVAREDPTRLLGYLGRAGVLRARRRLLEEEHVRERGMAPASAVEGGSTS